MLLNTLIIVESKRADPTAYLEGMGFSVRKEGRHLSVRLGGDERYRITRKGDGHWVACDKTGTGIGDNIALVRDLEPALSFLEAVARLAEGPVVKREPLPEPARRTRPARLPQTRADRHAGRVYLQGRGISAATLDHAERTGFLRYTGGGVLFVGRDVRGEPRNVTKRIINPGPGEKPKRDLAGSDKAYPPILPGNPRVVWIVEGGVDALAARDLALRRGKAPPTVLVSGGAGVRLFLDNPTVQTLLLHADAVVVRDNESTEKKQAETDAGHDRQIARIKELRGNCADWRPPAGVKDVAELNRREGTGAGGEERA